MEKIIKIFFFLISVFVSGGSIAQNLQNITDEKLLKIIQEYKSTNNDSDLNIALSDGYQNNVQALNWLETESKVHNNLLYVAGQVFLKSSLNDWKSKAEIFFQKSYQINKIYGSAHELGEMYLFGKGVQKNEKVGCEWLEKAYKINQRSFYNDQYALCLSPIINLDFRKSGYEACLVIKEVANLYDKNQILAKLLKFQAARAFALFADCLNEGTLGTKDLISAFDFYTKSSSLDNQWGAFMSGQMLENGAGTRQNNKIAMTQYIRSAELGFSYAQNYLGIVFAEGEIVPKNMIESYKWFAIATINGYGNALDNKKNAESKLNAAEKKIAEKAVQKWIEQSRK